jgi:hypothetical protein
LNLRTEAQIDPLGYQWRTAYTWLTGAYLDDSLDCAISASSSDGAVTAITSASMAWDSSSKGRVTFHDTGFLWAVFAQTGAADLDQSAWSYTFTTGNDRVFELRFVVGIGSSSGEDPSLEGFTLDVYQNQTAVFSETMDVQTNGAVSVPLETGETYTVVIRPNTNLSTGVSLGISTMWGDFHWQID